MSDLMREATIRVQASLYGDQDIRMIHELFFDTQDVLEQALAAPSGRLAGYLLQKITDGKVSLLTAEHKEDDIENLRKYQQERPVLTSNNLHSSACVWLFCLPLVSRQR